MFKSLLISLLKLILPVIIILSDAFSFCISLIKSLKLNVLATLEYVESLISTDADDPNVIVNGEITIEVDETDFDATHLPRIQAVSDKFATSLKTVTLTNTYSPTTVLSLANLGVPNKSESDLAFLKYKCAGCSHVKPIPP